MPDDSPSGDQDRQASDAIGRKPLQARWYRYTNSASLGIEIAVAVALCSIGGLWLQNNVTHWAPWTSLIGVGIGLGAATKAIVRTARDYRCELAQISYQESQRTSEDTDADGSRS